MTDTFSTVFQTILDEHKEKLTDGLYKQFCDLNLEIHKTEQNNLYTVKYISTKHVRISYNRYQTVVNLHKQIVKLTEDQESYTTKHG